MNNLFFLILLSGKPLVLFIQIVPPCFLKAHNTMKPLCNRTDIPPIIPVIDHFMPRLTDLIDDHI